MIRGRTRPCVGESVLLLGLSAVFVGAWITHPARGQDWFAPWSLVGSVGFVWLLMTSGVVVEASRCRKQLAQVFSVGGVGS